MAKKKATKKPTGGELGKVEAARAAELQTLRRLRRQQTAITEASRAVTRACRRADRARVEASRDLLEGTGWAAYEVAEMQRRERELEQARGEVDELRTQWEQSTEELRKTDERNQELRAELEGLRERAAVGAAR
jgi:chromosome segregation ATPase